MPETTLLKKVNSLSEQTIQLCYHCHKCTSGCPVAPEMQYGPDRVLRMVQREEKDRLLSSRDIWLCASCETCGARCPNSIDIARVMDALRQLAAASQSQRKHITIAEPDSLKFHRLFLFVVKKMGRMHEATLLACYKLWTLNLWADMGSGAAMFLKGKVPLLPHRIKGHKEVEKLFEKTKRELKDER